MKLCVKSLALTSGVVWGGSILLIGLVATIRGVHDGGYYGQDMLLLMASIYPGYAGIPAFGDTLLGALYGLVDGALFGAVVALIYNACVGRGSSAPAA